MRMSTPREVPPTEPRPIIPALGSFYAWSRDFSYLIIRVTAGGMLLVHGVAKLMHGSVATFATVGLARRGIEPALPLAYVVWTIETVGAVCIMLGLFTRFFAVAAGIQFTVIVFIAHWPQGFWFNRPGGGWEYPLLWGLMFAAIALRGGGPYSLDRKIGIEL
jgi:putative oxidoreductase